MATNSVLAQLSSAVYQNTGAPNGWARLDIPPPPNNVGYYGAAFQNNATGEIVLANRGTEPPYSLGASLDWSNNLQMAANQLPDQYQFANQFLHQVQAAYQGVSITLTGHSLGGTLAQLQAAETTLPGYQMLSAVTFNPYGAKDLIPAINTRYGLSLDPNASYSNITNHQTMLDGVSRLGSSSPAGSDQLGQMQTHVAASELVAALVVTATKSMEPVAFPVAYLAVDFYWSHSIERFTQEIYPQQALAAQVGQSFKDFVRTVNDQINAIKQAGATAQANLQNDFLQLAGTAGQTYQDAVNAASTAMGQMAGMLSAAEKQTMKSFIDFAFGFGNTINHIEQTINTIFTTAQRYIRPVYRDPLVLDLNNNGLETIGINTAHPILFDHNGDNVKTATGWVAPSDGLLVWDRNNNGAIDSGRELFGDATLKSNGLLATDGFDALADLDSNHNGTVDISDTNFANLRVWRDLNQDGLTQAGELTTLAAQNILSFNVAKTANSQTLANGNQIADLGSYTRSDGSQAILGNVTGSLADVNLASNPFYSQFTDTIPLTAAAQALPDMHGAGMVRNLREAASLPTTQGATLAATVAKFSAGAYDVHQATIDSLIQQWSATSTFATTADGAYGARPLTLNLEGITTGSAAYTAFLDKLSLIERFNGQTFRTIPADTTAPVNITLLREQQALVEQSYQALKLSVYNSLVVQPRLKPYFDAITLNLTASGISTDVSGINVALDAEWVDALIGHAGNNVLNGGLKNGAFNAANDAVFEMRRVG